MIFLTIYNKLLASVAHFWLHLLVIENHNQDLHEVFGANLLVEWCSAFVHQEIKQSE